MSGDRETGRPLERVDVLIVTALKLEYDAVLKVETGARPGSAWEKLPTPTGLEAAVRTFQTVDGRPLRVAVSRSLGMGEREATNAAVPLIKDYKPSCLAMIGVCAGRRGEVELGDVIIADRLWTYDIGQHVVERDESSGQEVERVKGDMLTYNLKPRWVHPAESFMPPADSSWLAERPNSYEAQMDWVLAQCVKGADPSQHPDSQRRCPNWDVVMELLWKKRQWLQDGTLELTEEGRRYIERQLLKYRGALLEPKPFKVHVAPIGSGSKVEKDPKIFEKLSGSMRKVLGLEMEAAAIGAMARLQEIPDMIVMKAVMDFADSEKSDHFKTFAARASAECLIAFLRENFAEPDSDDFKDILQPGTAAPPKYSNPSALLNARHEIVPFYEEGRSSLLEDLQQWCDATEKPVSIRLFHGAGGMGKTRLFIEWSKRLSGKHWRAGFLPDPVNTAHLERLVGSGRAALIIIDYAESRQDLKKLLEIAARRPTTGNLGPLRVVLLARTVGDWWRSLQEGTGPLAGLLKERLPTRVGALAQEPGKRAQIFLRAVEHFAGLLKLAPPQRSIPDLTDPLFDRALYILMAALATVQGWPVRTKVLMKEALKHEARFWRNHLQHLQLGDSQWRSYSLKTWRAVMALTLRGGASSESEAEQLLDQVNGSMDGWLLALLRDLYPGTRPGSYLSGMEPDLLGETAVLYTLRRPGAQAGSLLRRVFADDETGAVRTGLEMLGRLSVKHPRSSNQWVDQVLAQNLVTRAVPALEAAKVLGSKMAYSVLGTRLANILKRQGTAELAKQLEAAGLPEHTISLREAAVWVTETLLSELRTVIESKPAFDTKLFARRAQLLNHLGIRKRNVGQRQEALAATLEAVSLHRRLAKAHPEAFLPALANSLTNLGNSQRNVGRRQEALAATLEAVSLHRRLAETHPEVFLPDLAMSLTNLGAMQSDVGQRQEALAATLEAVSIRRRLAEAHSETFLPDLATSLTILGVMQSNVGQRQEALATTLKAVSIRRRLAETHPEAFLPALANSLTTLGNRQRDVGRRQEALAATLEAVSLYRRLAEAHPETFLPDLAMSLNNLGAMQRDAGQRQEALAATLEAVSLHRRLAEAHPEAFLPALAMSLTNLGNSQCDMGQRQEALAATLEAVSLHRRLAETHPEAFLPDLANTLNNLGTMQRDVGQRQKALAATLEAVSLHRRLAEAHPEAFLPALAMSLTNLGIRQSDVGQRQEALAATLEAVSLYRRLAEAHPETFLLDLAMSLNNLGTMQRDAGQRQEALAATLEAVSLYRRLAETHPEAFLPNLAMSLNNLGNSQCDVGQRQEALAVTLEAVSLHRRLAEIHGKAFLPDLANSLTNLGIRQGDVGQRQEALAATLEAISIHRRLAEAHPEAFLPALAMSLTNLGIRQSDVGQQQEALAATLEAVSLYRRLAEAHPETFLPNLAMNLTNLGAMQGDVGQQQEALAATLEAISIHRRLAGAHPEAFLPNLAASLNNLGDRQIALDLNEDALQSFQEALNTIWPFFERLPEAFAQLTSLMLKDVMVTLERLGRHPSQELLERLVIFRSKIPE
jgi:nucleoside phosphorylase